MALLAGAAVASAQAQVAAPPFEFDGVGRVVAVSDVHGAHQAFVETLRSAGVLDGAGDWAAGRAHLVVLGDIPDRGDDSRAAMELVMRLEPQAEAAGGRVHVVLGNHDVMNVVGDLRYVTRGEFAAFAAEEPAEARETAYARYAARAGAGPAPTREAFDDQFPPGFFGHRAAFAASGKYGRWLLGKPLALRINDTLFVHAGLSAALPDATLRGLNGPLRAGLVEFAALLERLTTEGRLDPLTDFHGIPAAVEAAIQAAGADADPGLKRLLELRGSPLFASASPLWYRGNAGCGPLVEQERLSELLRAVGARRVVIGHTPTYGRQAWRRLGDRVWMIDTGMQRAYYSGRGTALVLADGPPVAVYQGAPAPAAVDALPERAGALSANLGPWELETALTEGQVVARSPADDGDILTLRWRDYELQARFDPAASARGPFPEAAAYRLDRLLDLAMVPAAVVRIVDGRRGSLQHLPPSLVGEPSRAAGEARVDAWCPLKDQWQAMYAFDALIGNRPRSTTDIQYVAGSGQLVLTGHGTAFGTAAEIPAHLAGVVTSLNGEWRDRLAALESPRARDQLLEVLTRAQYEALLRRAVRLAR